MSAQTPQIIITEPASLVGRYAAVTFGSAPGAFASLNAIPQAEFFVYDYINCAKKTFSKPVAGDAKGKVALVMETDSDCRFDDAVRIVEAEGASAVVLAFANASIGRAMGHSSDTRGISIASLFLANGAVAGAIRDAVVKGFVVKSSFQTIQYLKGGYAPLPILPGQVRPGYVSMIPSIGASINYASVDLFRSTEGIQTIGRFITPCVDTTYAYSPNDKAILIAVPSTLTFTGRCTLTYLISDSAKYEVVSQVDILIGVPSTYADFAWTQPNTSVEIDILANDMGDDSTKDPARIDLLIDTDAIDQSVTTNQGAWQVKLGKLVFTPANNFSGTASLRYRVGGKNGGFSPDALVKVKVSTDTPKFAGAIGVAREFYLPSRDIYFRTANKGEADFVAKGGAGPWIETFNEFPVGGSNQICRFYGNTKIDPVTNAVYGPQSHFYTIDQGECDTLKKSYVASAKSWNFESLDFSAIPLNADKTCLTDTVPVYRMYNNGFPKKDSNHRYSIFAEEFRALIPLGWTYENAVFCVPYLL